MAEQCTLY